MDCESSIAGCRSAIAGGNKKGRDRIAALPSLIGWGVGYGMVPNAAAAGQLLLNVNQPTFAGL
jgi:hypothetical protein